MERAEKDDSAIDRDLGARSDLLRNEIIRLRKLQADTKVVSSQLVELALTNLNVEKAQYHSTRRGKLYIRLAIALIAGIFGLIAGVLYALIFKVDPVRFTTAADAPSAAVVISHTVVIATALFAAIYFLVSLARAFLHEGTALFHRRHALRLGQLFVYLRFAGLRNGVDLKKSKQTLSPIEFARIFGWNFEPSTAFKDINPAEMSGGILSRVIRRSSNSRK